ncbi:MAG: sulfurtransferase [Pseudomonadota bacterium]
MSRFIRAGEVQAFEGRILDCRFSLADSGAGRVAYLEGHVPGAHFLDLATQMSAPVAEHGGRHPLPSPANFARVLADYGVGQSTQVLLYDDSDGLFAARAWWMLRALGYVEPLILAGGYAAWLALGAEPETGAGNAEPCAAAEVPAQWPGCFDREALADRQAEGALLVDAREGPRYRGEVEPIDPVAGHIPGAVNLPWKEFVDAETGIRSPAQLRETWGELLEADELIVYCGSGVSACVNLLSLAELGYDGARLYAGSWSDWCSYL